MEKMRRWQDTIAWATDNGCVEAVSSIPDEDFYFAGEQTTYVVGPAGGPMYRPWDFDRKRRPRQQEIARHFETLKSRWSAIVGFELARFTHPLAFTGGKARRLLVHADGSHRPPWGGWSYLSSVDSERRTFTRFRGAINNTIAPHEIDHVDFTTDVEPVAAEKAPQAARPGASTFGPILEHQVNADHERNLEEAIDALLDNVFWAWNYFFALEGLHDEYKASPESFNRVGALTTCLWHAIFDALLVKSGQFIDRTKNVRSVYYLFKILRQYRPGNTELLCQVQLHEQALLGVPANTIAQRIESWRNHVVAHLTLNGMNPSFFEENRIALSELKAFLHQIDGAVQFYSQVILNRTNDTITAARQQKHDIRNLFRGAGAEPRAAGDAR